MLLESRSYSLGRPNNTLSELNNFFYLSPSSMYMPVSNQNVKNAKY